MAGSTRQWLVARRLDIASLALVGVGFYGLWVVYTATQRQQHDEDLVVRAYEVLSELRGAASSVQEAEAAAGRYVATGDEGFLRGLQAGGDAAQAHLAAAKLLDQTEPDKLTAIDGLEQLIGQRLAILDVAVTTRQEQGSAAAAQLVATGTGAVLMEELRATVARIEEDERRALDDRRSASADHNDTARVTLAGLAGVALVGLVLAIVSTRRVSAIERRATGAETRLREIVAASSDAIMSASLAGKFTAWSPGAERLLGYAPEEVIGQPMRLIAPPDRQEEGLGFVKAVASGLAVTGVETVRLAKGGALVDVSISVFPLRTANGRLVGFGATMRDIRDRKTLDEALRDAHARTRAILTAAPDGVIVAAEDGTIEFFNPAAERMFGYRAEEAIGRGVLTLLPDSYRLDYERGFQQYVKTGSGWNPGSVEIEGRRKDGSTFPMEVEVARAHVNGRLLITALARDISDRRAAEDEIRAASDEAERANQAKSEFLSRMSHELRTPLNVILGFGQLLQLEPLEPGERESVDYIVKAGRHLLDLIDDVLHLSRMDSGKQRLSLEPIQVGELVQDAVDLVRPLAQQRSIVLEFDEAGCEVYVLADRQRLKQALLNLLSNGIKYNREAGSLRIRCEAVEEQRLRILVTDTGPGIPEDKLHRVFAPFDRLGAETTTVEGTGLGLSLSQRLVEAMSGRIGVESVVGAGSTFWIELATTEEHPELQTELAAPATPATPQVSGGPKVVLYVEDNLPNLAVVEKILARRPHVRLIPAMQGRMGLELARQHRPHVIILDLHLPDMRGDQVLRALRDDPLTAGIPVVIASADATPRQVDRLLEAGARTYLTKPLDVAGFLEVIDELLAESDAG